MHVRLCACAQHKFQADESRLPQGNRNGNQEVIYFVLQKPLNRNLPLLEPLDGLIRLRAAINVNKTNRSVQKGICATPCPHQERQLKEVL